MKLNYSSVLLHIKQYPLAFTGIIFSGFISSCLSFFITLTIGEFFSLYFNTGSTKTELLSRIGLKMDNSREFFMVFAFLLIIRSVISYFENLGTYRQGELYVKNLREKVFASQMNWQPEALSAGGHEKYLLRYSNDLKSVQNYLMLGIMGGIKNLLFFITGLFVLAGIHFKLTLIFLSLIALITLAIYIIAAYQVPLIAESRSKRSSLLAFVAKSLAGFRKIKQNYSETDTVKRFFRRSANLYNANMASNKIESLIQSSTFFLLFVMIGILLWQMSKPYILISASDGLTIVLIIMMMQNSMRRILKVPGYLNKGRISLRKIENLLQNEKVNEVNPYPVPDVADLE